MNNYRIITLRERPELVAIAAEWFHSKWGVPAEAYLECMKAYLSGKTEYGWYICLYDESIVAGLGVIENDFHDRKDLTPNVCAVYAEEEHREKGLAGNLLNKVVDDMRNKGVTPLYLVTDHIGFYERYGWEFLCMVQGEMKTKYAPKSVEDSDWSPLFKLAVDDFETVDYYYELFILESTEEEQKKIYEELKKEIETIERRHFNYRIAEGEQRVAEKRAV